MVEGVESAVPLREGEASAWQVHQIDCVWVRRRLATVQALPEDGVRQDLSPGQTLSDVTELAGWVGIQRIQQHLQTSSVST